MNLYPVSVVLLLLCFLNKIIASSDDPTDVSVNCGSTGTSAARSGREWRGDSSKMITSLVDIKGSSTTSGVIHGHNLNLGPIPYKTARLSRTKFSYAFQLNPGQKVIRLHFSSAPYKGFNRYKDLFTVEAGPFTLLSNFSASLAAGALGVNSFVKEFCINVEDDHLLQVSFTPASSQLHEFYAFINGIEIISVPAAISYFHTEDIGVPLVGKSPFYIDSNTALEIIRRLNTRQGSISTSNDDIGDGFGMWETVPKQKEKKANNVTWRVSVDVGFRYLVRLHFYGMGLKFAELGANAFEVYIDNKIANTTSGIVEDRRGWYRDYMVVMRGSKHEGKRDISICLQSSDEVMDGHGLLKGFEVLKLSNPDNSLAGANPTPFVNDSTHKILQIVLRVIGHKSALAAAAMIVLVVVNTIVYILWRIQEASHTEEENRPSAKAERLCRRFSLAEIQLATRNFSDAHLIGRGGFGKVYKGIIDNGQETVAIKRLKAKSHQGAYEFLTEIETLTELRHANLVSLIGYCNERKEMILVYEYMAFGTLADHLFKLVRDDDSNPSLTWRQCLNVCIGAGRGLDYLHTGHSIIHRDIKASNILLDEDFTAKVSDFGLAKHLSSRKLQQSHVSTKVKGTFGYLDPEYFSTGKLTKKSDTYSFGVVLLEVLCGRRAIDRGFLGNEQILIRWAQENISQGKTDQIVSSSLKNEISDGSLKAFVEIAEKCLYSEPKKRPTMAQVVIQLEYALEQQENPNSIVSSEKSNLAENSPLNEEASTSDSPVQLKMASEDVVNVTPPTKDELNYNGVNAELPPSNKDHRKARTYNGFRFWPRVAFWNRSQESNKNELPSAGTCVSEVDKHTVDILQISIPSITLDELKNATDNFSSTWLIGERIYGNVYHGRLKDQKVAEIRIIQFIKMPEQEFQAKVSLASTLKHKNIVELCGYCVDTEFQALASEFSPYGSLYDILHENKNCR
ncbi:putative receptor-like protein kinase At5g39000 isoform X2 [Andrographis paniculata]|uniref:putative receptor-like protein kinase At5g39000 isoform X2 n=1 Tax=Andrographis paniculata TaxID=175694 RepID=UPI0021E81B24|nr:putative receptor-like protein kinase At5g39000 isoform X2 [Andrographis paniculata]